MSDFDILVIFKICTGIMLMIGVILFGIQMSSLTISYSMSKLMENLIVIVNSSDNMNINGSEAQLKKFDTDTINIKQFNKLNNMNMNMNNMNKAKYSKMNKGRTPSRPRNNLKIKIPSYDPIKEFTN